VVTPGQKVDGTWGKDGSHRRNSRENAVSFENGRTLLRRRRARYHLVKALFQPPLAERSVTVSVSRALQWSILSPKGGK
jgi:hypothetical protein